MKIYEKMMRSNFEKPISKLKTIRRQRWYDSWMAKHASRIALKGIQINKDNT